MRRRSYGRRRSFRSYRGRGRRVARASRNPGRQRIGYRW
nr:MAG: hypothetical protein [Microvirus sp.]